MDRSCLLYIVAMAGAAATERDDIGYVFEACGEVFSMLSQCESMKAIRQTEAFKIVMAFSAGDNSEDSSNGKQGKEVWE